MKAKHSLYKPKPQRLSPDETAFLLLITATQPSLTLPQVNELLVERFDRTISQPAWKDFRDRNAQQIEELKQSSEGQLKAAFDCGLIKLSNPLNRLHQLEQLVTANIEGYQTEVSTKDGIVSITRKDHRVALQGLKQIKEELEQLGIKDEPEDLSLNISVAQLPEQEDVSELLEQEGLSLEDL